jgi:hypothetical protein
MILIGVALLNRLLKQAQATQVSQLWRECDSRHELEYGVDPRMRPDEQKRHALSLREK